MDSIPQKQCYRCKKLLPATPDYFRRDKSKKDGWFSCCKACVHQKTREIIPDGFLKCSRCKSILPATDEYFSHRNRPDRKRKFDDDCKRCRCEIAKERYIPSTRVLLTKEERKQRKSEQDRRYVETNRDKVDAYQKDYYLAHREREIERTRQWVKDNPERARLNNKQRKSKRRALEASAEGAHTAKDIKLQYQSQHGLCWWCGKSLGDKWHADHLTPLNRGGTNWPNNIVCSCARCNQSRKDSMAWEWNGKLL